MSIIYDALKKVEKSANREIISEVNKERSKPRAINYLLYVLVICAGLFLANLMFGVISPVKNIPTEKPTARPASAKNTIPVAATAKPGKVTLAKTKVAMPEEKTAPIPAASQVVEVKKTPEIPPLLLNGVFYSRNEATRSSITA